MHPYNFLNFRSLLAKILIHIQFYTIQERDQISIEYKYAGYNTKRISKSAQNLMGKNAYWNPLKELPSIFTKPHSLFFKQILSNQLSYNIHIEA